MSLIDHDSERRSIRGVDRRKRAGVDVDGGKVGGGNGSVVTCGPLLGAGILSPSTSDWPFHPAAHLSNTTSRRAPARDHGAGEGVSRVEGSMQRALVEGTRLEQPQASYAHRRPAVCGRPSEGGRGVAMGGPVVPVFDCAPRKQFGDQMCTLDPKACSEDFDFFGIVKVTSCGYDCPDLSFHSRTRVRILGFITFG